jgi:ABC-type lipopolysaccharide export system ATPase subunit
VLRSCWSSSASGNVRRQKGYTSAAGNEEATEIARALASNPQFLLLDETLLPASTRGGV